ncbi:MAG: DEAD/DEAH box helicase family protein [Candidatus Heimdallarchaeota archaeon]|nr:MAG: DEAD/DEAH box helicase family protein [Candidatus Heimdallarchaeota archaeon]
MDLDLKKHLGGLTIEQREYQLTATQEIITQLPNSSLLNYPYGTGKTIIALLLFLSLKKMNPKAKFIFTSAREAAALRCRQALEMAKSFGFVDKLGYLFDPKTGGKGLSLAQKEKMYSVSDVIFSPITALMNDRFEIKSRRGVDIFKSVQLCVIDEATDLLARSMTGFRLSKFFEELFQVRPKVGSFPVLGMTGTRDQYRAQAIIKILGEGTHLMQRPELSPYETITQFREIDREDYKHIDKLISTLLTKPITTVQELLDPQLSRLDIIKLSYGGALDRLKDKQASYPIRIGKYKVADNDAREQLVNAFSLLFKLTHARLLLLDSTPGEFLRYIKIDENQEAFQNVIEASSSLISHRSELPRFDKPEETTTRGLINPKVDTAIELIHEHIIRGAKVLLFTRYLALGEQTNMLLNKALGFPGVKYLSGQTPEDTRRIILEQFQQEDVNVLIFTPVGGRGLNLGEADVVIHLDITSNLDDMIQRRERARGCLEYVLVLKGTSEEAKVKEYAKITTSPAKSSQEE